MLGHLGLQDATFVIRQEQESLCVLFCLMSTSR